MGVLYIVSVEEAAGKTAICAGIAINLVNAGKKAGYLKPQAVENNTPDVGVSDGDIGFMRKTLGLTDPVNAPDLVTGRDIVLVEARMGATPTATASKDAYGAAKEMKAKVIAVESYSTDNVKYAELYKGFGESFLGVIINKVPRNLVKKVKAAAAAAASNAGPVKVLGVIPENRILLAVTVAELAEGIKGKIINHTENNDELVENFMLGALTPDSGTEYFCRKGQKAAVIRQDRPDMQLAALETPTIALVSAGSTQPPIYSVIYKAQQKGIPVITTASGVTDVVNNIESSLARTRLNQEKKLAALGEIVKQNLDMKIFG